MSRKTNDEVYPIGTKVKKISGKPFKSTFKINTVKDIVDSPFKIDKNTGKPVLSYMFEEDESFVCCNRCIKA